MRRFVLFLLTLTILLVATATPTHAAKEETLPATSAAAFALIDAASGTLLAEKNADERRPMASTTKIMTALLVIESLPLDTVITVPEEAVGVEGSSIYLYKGEQLSVKTLLYGLMLSSANDAAVALAIAVAGDVPAFVAKMNERAAALGLADTHFCNPNGLHDEAHYTSARDLAHLTAYALSNEVFAEIVQTKRYAAPQNGTDATRLFINHNRLLRTLDGAVGVKTGFTRAAGRCLVSAVSREGLTLVAVTLDAPSDWRDHEALHEWGFRNFAAFTPPASSLTLPVVGGKESEVVLKASDVPTFLVERESEISCRVIAPRFLFAGFDEGAKKGVIRYYLGTTLLGEVPLYTATAVEREAPRFGARLLQFFKNLF